jgi:hypothetical protein
MENTLLYFHRAIIWPRNQGHEHISLRKTDEKKAPNIKII